MKILYFIFLLSIFIQSNEKNEELKTNSIFKNIYKKLGFNPFHISSYEKGTLNNKNKLKSSKEDNNDLNQLQLNQQYYNNKTKTNDDDDDDDDVLIIVIFSVLGVVIIALIIVVMVIFFKKKKKFDSFKEQINSISFKEDQDKDGENEGNQLL